MANKETIYTSIIQTQRVYQEIGKTTLQDENIKRYNGLSLLQRHRKALEPLRITFHQNNI